MNLNEADDVYSMTVVSYCTLTNCNKDLIKVFDVEINVLGLFVIYQVCF